MNKSRQRLIAIFTLFFFLAPGLGRAAEENYNYIISDQEAENYTTMDKNDIEDFLLEHGSYLAGYSYMGDNPSPAQLALDPEKKYFKTRSAAEIIYNSAQEWHINPQFLLTMMEKEMSLITDSDPVENQLAYAMGYDCPDSGGCGFKTKGFGKQVRAAAEQFRWFIDNIYEYNWHPGKTSCADDPNPFLPCTSRGTEVTPENKITAAMYLYTPHIHGNMLFAKLWKQFGFAGGTIEEPVVVPSVGIFPDGSIIKAKDSEDGAIYLISEGKKRPFASMSALVSRYNPDNILLVDQAEIEKYDQGKEIIHTNYSVLKDSKDQRYLIDGLEKRLIESDEAFRQLGFNPDEVELVDDSELNNYETGAVLTEASSPFKELWQDLSTGAVYLVKDGEKARIIDQEILDMNFPDMEIREVTSKTLEDMPTTNPIKLNDGALIKKEFDKNVYVVSSGYRRLIPDAETFNTLGYNWVNIKVVSNKVMNFHKIGDPIPIQ